MYARQYCSTYSLYMRNDRLSLTSKAVISWYDFLKGLTVWGQCPFTNFSITVLYGAVKLSVARGKADSSRADVVLYGVDIVSGRQQHIQYIAYMMWWYIQYIALWTAVIHLQSLITRRPQVQGLSPQPCLTVDFVRNRRFFVFFGELAEAWVDVPAPIVPPRGIKLGEWILWRLQNMCRYFVFKWLMRYTYL